MASNVTSNVADDANRTDYVKRIADAELKRLLAVSPVVSIDGPRGTGKTTTALQVAKSVFRLDDPTVRRVVAADPTQLLKSQEPILIDEWQRLPESWDLVRREADKKDSPGRFILTGSASPQRPPTHSGAGRVISMRMRPMSLVERWATERWETKENKPQSSVSLAALLTGDKPDIEGQTSIGLADYIDEIIHGGFPAMRNQDTESSQMRLEGYLKQIVEKDFPDSGRTVRNPVTLENWMAAYAAATATTASFETIREAATSNEGSKPSHHTTKPYTDVLKQMWVVDPVPAWQPTTNRISQLNQSAKHHLADPALAVALLGVDAAALLTNNPAKPPAIRDGLLAGTLFESLMALDLRVYAQASRASVRHFYAKGGKREVDFIIERRDRKVVAVEVKLKQLPDADDCRHLRWLKDKLGDDLLDAVIITTGPSAYRQPEDEIAVVPAALLGP